MRKMISRRHFLLGSAAMALVLPSALPALAATTITKTEEEWKMTLTPKQFHILREHGTERAFTSPLLEEKRKGTFACAGCGNELFRSEWKFDSGTGWPSFYECIPGSLGTNRDATLGMVRTEFHCARCGGHHGHLFDDGPAPTGLRYCANGEVLTFTPATEQK